MINVRNETGIKLLSSRISVIVGILARLSGKGGELYKLINEIKRKTTTRKCNILRLKLINDEAHTITHCIRFDSSSPASFQVTKEKNKMNI